jgi:hypothetical protein
MAEMGQMYAYLVRAPGLEATLDEARQWLFLITELLD